MRILFDSHNPQYKTPFGTLVPEEVCTMRVHIPVSCRTESVWLVLRSDSGAFAQDVTCSLVETVGDYEIWQGEFSLSVPDLYFYYFRVQTENECFRLFRYHEHDTNMEEGALWQLSCVTEKYPAPQWAKGAVMYQIFPDRFSKAGECDLTEKLRPYSLHENWNEAPNWQPAEDGEIYNDDFFGGNLRGIAEKLPYLQSLGVELIYLNPIFMAYSNHRYDTCDYRRIDPMLGTEEDFAALCEKAHALGIRIILDGVFSHVGSRSVYFEDAIQNPDSPYIDWFRFQEYPHKYECWWNFKTLPNVDELSPAFLDFIIDSEDSVLAKWLRLGADGFRLDVADELPDAFISRLRRRLRQLKPDALLLGEVWEDASNKVAYDTRRRYFTDGELDGVMNYPWRTAVLRFARGSDDGTALGASIETLAEHYPADVLACTMNMLSSHDSARALTELAAPFEGSREAMASHILTPQQRQLGLARLRLAAALLYCLPGMPCIYYGDEAGMEGCKDPFNRATFPWGREDASLTEHFRSLAALRKEHPALRYGSVKVLAAGNGRLVLRRAWNEQSVTASFDANSCTWEFEV